MINKVLIICFISLSTLAYSQEEHSIVRKGFVFGTSIGISHSLLTFPSKKHNEAHLALDFKIGYMLKSNIALLLTSNTSVYSYSGIGRDRLRDFGVLAPSIQYWYTDKVWIMGGIGLGIDAPVFFDIKDPDLNEEERVYHNGLGIIGAIGYEFYQGKKFMIDLKAKITYRNVNIIEGKTTGISPAILIGINFY